MAVARCSSDGTRVSSIGPGTDLVGPMAAATTRASPKASPTKSAGLLRNCSSKMATPITKLTTGSTVMIAGRLDWSGPAW